MTGQHSYVTVNSSSVYTGVHSWCLCVQQLYELTYPVIRVSYRVFSRPWKSQVPSFHPVLQPLAFQLSPSFCLFYKVRVGIIQYLIFLDWYLLLSHVSLRLLHVLIAHFSSVLSNTPLFRWTSLFIYLPTTSKFWQFWINLRQTLTCMRQVLRAGALRRPRGMGWRGRREGRSGWGTHVNPWLIHVNFWQKPLQYCKVISLQLIKKKWKKKMEKK